VTEPGGQAPATGSRWGRIGRPTRWLLVAVVLAVAVTVAVWPRGTSAPAVAPATASLAAEQARADLPGCPSATATPTGPLAAVHVTCLADGHPVDLGALLAGRPTLVNIWASWCQPCQQELPVLNSYAAQPGAVRVIGVQVQSPAKDGLDLLAGLGVHLPTVFDATGAFDNGGPASTALGLPVALPVTYLVRPDGTATVVRRPAQILLSVDAVRQAVATYSGGGGT
jgi:thiol-disulfide isomerase/thioredoxin